MSVSLAYWLVILKQGLGTPEHIEMHRVGSPEYFEYNRLTHRWDKRSMPTLTEGEKSVITLSIQGFTMSEIAEFENKYIHARMEALGSDVGGAKSSGDFDYAICRSLRLILFRDLE